MDLRHISSPNSFPGGDEYIINFLFPNHGRKFGKLMEIRRMAAQNNIQDLMSKGRDELLLSISDACGWEAIYNYILPDLGFPRAWFLNGLDMSRQEFHEFLASGKIRQHGEYRFTKFGVSQYSPGYNIYDYYKLKIKGKSDECIISPQLKNI